MDTAVTATGLAGEWIAQGPKLRHATTNRGHADWISSYIRGFEYGATRHGPDARHWRFNADAWAEGHRAGIAARAEAERVAAATYEHHAERYHAAMAARLRRGR